MRRAERMFDSGLSLMMASATKLAESIIADVPQDRPVPVAELQKVEAFVCDTVVAEMRPTAEPLPLRLVMDDVERRFRQRFAERFYQLAPLARVAEGGEA